MNFVIIGLGYVAPKHLKAIKDVGGNLIEDVRPLIKLCEELGNEHL